MDAVISGASEEKSKYAPRIHTIMIPTDKIRDLIGPGGKVIRGIVEATGAKIDVDDTGRVNIASSDMDGLAKAIQMVSDITAVPEVGKTYLGKVVRLAEFGAFVEIFPGTDGLLHVSEIAEHRVKDVKDELRDGDQVLVKVLAIEGNRIKLSRKAVLREQRAKLGLPEVPESTEGGGDRGGRGERSERGDRASRDRDRDRGPRPERTERPDPPKTEETVTIEGGEGFDEEDEEFDGEDEGVDDGEMVSSEPAATSGSPAADGRPAVAGQRRRRRRGGRRGGPGSAIALQGKEKSEKAAPLCAAFRVSSSIGLQTWRIRQQADGKDGGRSCCCACWRLCDGRSLTAFLRCCRPASRRRLGAAAHACSRYPSPCFGVRSPRGLQTSYRSQSREP
jgi:polyribonucleotide nucleotidyltransferase